MKSRIVVLFIGICGLWGILALRAASLQVLPNARLESLRQRQFRTVVTLQARRGAITDREGRDLALSTTAFSLYADPKVIDNRRQASHILAKELGQSFESIYSKLKDSSKRFVWINRMLDPETADRIRSKDIHGLSLVQEWRRVYPNESILAHTLGFLGVDGQALEGIELQYDNALRGNQKKVVVRRDARGRPLMADGLLFQQNPDGSDLTLTVDSEIQYMLESELVSAVSEFEADSAVGIVLDAQTSAIRAIATVPTFDDNKALKTSSEIRRNRALSDAFEPGSTMKSFVVAAALKEHKLQANSKYFCENGSYRVGDRVIHEADASENFGWLTVSEILARSSNIGATKIAFQIGEENLRKTLLEFGFGQKIGIDLPGEAHGLVQALPWHSHLLSNVSFGHGIAATPLQIANGYAAIANGGTLNTPYIVQSQRDSETGIVTETKSKSVRRVLTSDEAAQMRIMLSAVTQPGGTGTNAKVNGFIVAGKTGTAQKADIKHGGYIKGAYVSSFAGFIPASDPRFVIYVAVDRPRKAYYGAQVAAPIFAKIASYAVRKEGIAPMMLTDRNMIRKKGALRAPAIEAADLTLATDVLSTRDSKPAEFVPELDKLTMREVLRKINGKDVHLKVIGQGVVAETWPKAGESIPGDRQVTVFLK